MKKRAGRFEKKRNENFRNVNKLKFSIHIKEYIIQLQKESERESQRDLRKLITQEQHGEKEQKYRRKIKT